MDAIEILDIPLIQADNQPTLLFTDGSCSQPGPGRGSERHAAFAVRRAFQDSHESVLIAAGVLPGRKQSPFRAELYAFMIAMSASLDAVVFTDCKAVFQGITRMQREGWCELAWLSSPDFELWRAAWLILRHPQRKLQAVWLESHRSLNQARSAADSWRIYHNSQVDRSGSILNNKLPCAIQEIHARLVEQNTELETLRGQITFYLKAVWNMHAAREAATRAPAAAPG